MRSVVTSLLCLWLPGVIPALVVADDLGAVVFSSALIGGLLAALAALGELVVGGGLGPWYVGLAVGADVLCAGLLVRRYRPDRRPVSGGAGRRGRLVASVAVAVVAAGACAWPATALGAHLIGYDTHAIWILHSMLVYGGHTQYLAALRSPAYAFTNPDYPPLASAAGAIGFLVAGRVDYHLAITLTTALDASAVALLATGLARVSGRTRSPSARVAAVGLAGAFCLVCFGVAGQYAVDGYADLLWSAAAAAAVLYGLVLPRSRRHLAMAWLCATVAALTKNEGLIAAVVVLCEVALRYLPVPEARSGRHRLRAELRVDGSNVRLLFRRAALALVLILPGAAWAIAVKLEGVGNLFFGAPPPGSKFDRFTTTVSGLWPYLHVLPLAAAVALLGALVLRHERRAAGTGNPAWLWAALALWAVGLLYTYTFGQLDIAWWLRTSADRTTIFPQILLLADMTVWTVLAIERRHRRISVGERV